MSVASSASHEDDDAAGAICTLTCTVAQEEAWLFEGTRYLLEQLGVHGWNEQMEALLAEGQGTLLNMLPEGALELSRLQAADVAQRQWGRQLAGWRTQAEVLCEKNVLERSRCNAASSSGASVGTVAIAAARGMAALAQLPCLELDRHVRDLTRAMARHELELSLSSLQLHRADGWRRLGYASEAQYAIERLGVSRSAFVARRTLALRLEKLRGVAAALGSGQIGVEAALQLVRVATAETESAWVERAKRRTIKHLREEVSAALVALRCSGESGCPPPAEDEMNAFFALEQAVVSGRIALTQLVSDPLHSSERVGIEPHGNGRPRGDDPRGDGLRGDDGPHDDGPHDDGPHDDGPHDDGPRRDDGDDSRDDGLHDDGLRGDDPRDDGLRGDDPRDDGLRGDDPRDDGPRGDDPRDDGPHVGDPSGGRMGDAGLHGGARARHAARPVSPGPRIAEPVSEGRRAWFVMLGSLAAWLEGALQTSAARAATGRPRVSMSAGRVALRLRMACTTATWWRGLEAQARRWLSPGLSWLRFLCLSLWHAWQHLLATDVAYAHIYVRDRFRCMSPVCNRRDVTPHHLHFRSAGGSDDAYNVGSFCTWCHLRGVHGGRIRAHGTAAHIRWELGPRGSPCVVVAGRERVAVP